MTAVLTAKIHKIRPAIGSKARIYYIIGWSDGTYVSEAANMRNPDVAIRFATMRDARQYLGQSYPDAYPWYGHWTKGGMFAITADVPDRNGNTVGHYEVTE